MPKINFYNKIYKQIQHNIHNLYYKLCLYFKTHHLYLYLHLYFKKYYNPHQDCQNILLIYLGNEYHTILHCYNTKHAIKPKVSYICNTFIATANQLYLEQSLQYFNLQNLPATIKIIINDNIVFKDKINILTTSINTLSSKTITADFISQIETFLDTKYNLILEDMLYDYSIITTENLTATSSDATIQLYSIEKQKLLPELGLINQQQNLITNAIHLNDTGIIKILSLIQQQLCLPTTTVTIKEEFKNSYAKICNTTLPLLYVNINYQEIMAYLLPSNNHTTTTTKQPIYSRNFSALTIMQLKTMQELRNMAVQNLPLMLQQIIDCVTKHFIALNINNINTFNTFLGGTIIFENYQQYTQLATSITNASDIANLNSLFASNYIDLIEPCVIHQLITTIFYNYRDTFEFNNQFSSQELTLLLPILGGLLAIY